MSDRRVIPEAAVEAAADAWTRLMCGCYDPEDVPHLHDELRKILESAAPHMLADARDEGCEAMHATTGGEWPPIHEDNPYRTAL